LLKQASHQTHVVRNNKQTIEKQMNNSLPYRSRFNPNRESAPFEIDAFAKTRGMAKQKIRPTRLGGFSGAKAYIRYVEVLKNRRNAKGGLFATPSRLHPIICPA
jgi:hypothetical protein